MTLNDKLKTLVASYDLAAYEITEQDDGYGHLYEVLKLTFPSGQVLSVRSNCGTAADAGSYLEIEES